MLLLQNIKLFRTGNRKQKAKLFCFINLLFFVCVFHIGFLVSWLSHFLYSPIIFFFFLFFYLRLSRIAVARLHLIFVLCFFFLNKVLINVIIIIKDIFCREFSELLNRSQIRLIMANFHNLKT
jgi:hypothetical protein